MNERRLSARDYKRSRRGGFNIDPTRLRPFGFGLVLGLIIAAVVFITDHRASQTAPDALRPVPGKRAPGDAGNSRNTHPSAAQAASANVSANNGAAVAGADGTDDTGAGDGKYDFYRMLPKFEVVVPEHEHGTHLAPTAQIDRPGIYFLQVGSYRDAAVAERVRAQLGKLGVAATVQRVAVDADVWHRVRVGPIRDLTVLNRLRRQLQASDLDSLVIRVDD